MEIAEEGRPLLHPGPDGRDPVAQEPRADGLGDGGIAFAVEQQFLDYPT